MNSPNPVHTLSTNERGAFSHVTSRIKRQLLRCREGIAGRLLLISKCHYCEKVGVFQRRIRENTRSKTKKIKYKRFKASDAMRSPNSSRERRTKRKNSLQNNTSRRPIGTVSSQKCRTISFLIGYRFSSRYVIK